MAAHTPSPSNQHIYKKCTKTGDFQKKCKQKQARATSSNKKGPPGYDMGMDMTWCWIWYESGYDMVIDMEWIWPWCGYGGWI